MTTIANATDIVTLTDTDMFAVQRSGNTTAYKATVAEIRTQAVYNMPAVTDGSWNHAISEATFDGQKDQLLFIGFNVDGHSGSAPDESLQSIYIGFESDYYTGGVHYGEYYVEWYSIDRLTHGRAMSFSVDLESGAATTQHWGKQIYYTDAGAAMLQIDDSVINVYSGVYFRALANNSSFMRQLNAAGNAYVPLIYLTSSDRVFLGDTGYNVQANGNFYFGIDSVGPVLIDRTTATNYRLYVDSGALAIEAI